MTEWYALCYNIKMNKIYKNIIIVTAFSFIFLFTQSAFAAYSSFQVPNSAWTGASMTPDITPDYTNIYTVKNDKPTQASNVKTTDNSTEANVPTDQIQNTPEDSIFSGLPALSLWGSNSFMPDTVFEWILVVVMILLIIILARQFKRKQFYEEHLDHAMKNH